MMRVLSVQIRFGFARIVKVDFVPCARRPAGASFRRGQMCVIVDELWRDGYHFVLPLPPATHRALKDQHSLRVRPVLVLG